VHPEPAGDLELRYLVVESAVRRVLARYCRGVDRMDADLVRSCYHEGATDSHGNFEGTVDEFVTWAFGLLAGYSLTMHVLSNVLVELDDDRPDVAFSEAYAIAYHRKDGGKPHRNLVTAFRYVDRFERRPVDGSTAPEWRIAERVVVTEWLRHDPPEGWWPVPDGFVAGRRDRTDPVYTLRRADGDSAGGS